MNSVIDNTNVLGCPIQRSPDQSLFANSPKLIASYNVFHRLLLPRHSPYALIHSIQHQIALLGRFLLGSTYLWAILCDNFRFAAHIQ